jgi:hypothetical protein
LHGLLAGLRRFVQIGKLLDCLPAARIPAAGVMLCLVSSALFIIVRSRTDMAD